MVTLRELMTRPVDRPRTTKQWSEYLAGLVLVMFGTISLGDRNYSGGEVAGPVCLIVGIGGGVIAGRRRRTANRAAAGRPSR